MIGCYIIYATYINLLYCCTFQISVFKPIQVESDSLVEICIYSVVASKREITYSLMKHYLMSDSNSRQDLVTLTPKVCHRIKTS